MGVQVVQQAKKHEPMNYNLEAGLGRKSYKVAARGLMIAFAVAWGALTILVGLQDRAIDSQRELIQLLMQDLHSALVTSVSHGNTASVPVVVQKVQLPSSQVQQQGGSPVAPSQQAPSQAIPKVQPDVQGSSRTPSTQEKNMGANRSRNSRRAAKPLPVRPPAQVTDPSDMRRVTFSI